MRGRGLKSALGEAVKRFHETVDLRLLVSAVGVEAERHTKSVLVRKYVFVVAVIDCASLSLM